MIGGSQREDNLELLESIIKEKGMDPAAYEGYLDLRRYGNVPHSGMGGIHTCVLDYRCHVCVCV